MSERDSSASGICQNPLFASILLKISSPASCARVSSTLGIGCSHSMASGLLEASLSPRPFVGAPGVEWVGWLQVNVGHPDPTSDTRVIFSNLITVQYRTQLNQYSSYSNIYTVILAKYST